MTICDSTEQHEHYALGTNQTILHKHDHSKCEKDFNRLHHHPPIEHENFTLEELRANVIYITKTPF